MYKFVRGSEATIRTIMDGKTAANLITKDISPAVSLATTESTNPDYHEQETTSYDRIYYVLEGSLILVIEGERAELSSGDACFIARHTTYEMSGVFKAITVNQPAFGS